MPVGDACTGSETPFTCTWDSAFCQPPFYGDPLAMVWAKSAGSVADIGWLSQGLYDPALTGFDISQYQLNNWANVSDASDDEGVFASVDMNLKYAGSPIDPNGAGFSTWLVASDFGLAVPDDASILGVRVAMKAKSDIVFVPGPDPPLYCSPIWLADALLKVGGNYYLQQNEHRE